MKLKAIAYEESGHYFSDLFIEIPDHIALIKHSKVRITEATKWLCNNVRDTEFFIVIQDSEALEIIGTPIMLPPDSNNTKSKEFLLF